MNFIIIITVVIPIILAQDNNNDEINSNKTFILYSKQITERAASILTNKFQQISQTEMGINTINKKQFNKEVTEIKDEIIIGEIADKLLNKIQSTNHILKQIKQQIYQQQTVSFIYPCTVQDNHLENIQINNQKVILNIPKNNCKACANDLIQKYQLKVERQGYLSVTDAGGVRECKERSTGGTRKLLHHSMQIQSKTIVILLDCGIQMGPEGLHTTAGIAKELLDLLRPEDSLAVVHLNHQPYFIELNDNCTRKNMEPFAYVTENIKNSLNKYLNSVEIDEEPSNVTLGIELLYKSVKNISGDLLVLYFGKQSIITTQVSELKDIFHKTIEENNKILFSGCSVPDPIEYVATLTTFHSHFINNNFTLQCNQQSVLCSDWLINLNSSQTPGEVASHLLLKLPLHPIGDDDRLQVAPPHWESHPTPSTLATFLVPFYIVVLNKGVVFLNLYLSDLAEDIIYFNTFSTNHRAFLIDFNGNVIAHSSYPRPELIITKPRSIDIINLENDANFPSVKSNMLQTSIGKMRINSTSYVWKWIKNIYIVCIVTNKNNQENNIHPDNGRPIDSTISQELQHHRMDLLPPANAPLCRHFLTVSTIHKGTLYLSPSSFMSPFSYLYDLQDGKDISLVFMQKYMAYLKDNTYLLSNPGLKLNIRSDVAILNNLLSFFKDRHIKGLYNKYIVRRYAATEHGVLVLFPGTILESDFEPNRKAWFLRALRNTGKIILTPPYLDIGGAGYIVTISQVPEDMSRQPSVVVSIDMTMRYLYKMLQEVFPICVNDDIRCFLMDDRGYLLSHPGLVDPSNFGPIEQTHITHKESHIVNDMLNHRDFVTKKLCKNYADSTLQRFYQFNISLDRVLTNFVQGDHYGRYYIAPIKGTNIFVGMVNSSSSAGVFCPCSVENRLCLNCNRMEQNECECPCECLLPEGDCHKNISNISLCEFESERNHQNNFYTPRYNLAPHLDSCFDFQCESYISKHTCLGVLGCEWCEIDRDRETPLMTPFCTAQPHCFGGVLNAPTPYEIGFFGQVTQDDLSPGYSAVGPIVGCIVGLCLIIALAVYCYRQNLSSTESEEPFQTPQDTWPHPPVQMNHLASEEDILDECSGHQDQLLLVAEPPVSPYRILTGYRRPPTAGESDHGYSTMTPHDDSEHQAFALVEPPSSPSLSTPRSSATDLPVTVLPCGKNNILAPVTVHRHMEAI